MIVRNYEVVEKFTRKHANARPVFNRWRDRSKRADWRDFTGVKRDFPAADKYRACVIFDLGGNNYRLIVKIDYLSQVVNVRKALTHAEYDKENWKSDCGQN